MAEVEVTPSLAFHKLCAVWLEISNREPTRVYQEDLKAECLDSDFTHLSPQEDALRTDIIFWVANDRVCITLRPKFKPYSASRARHIKCHAQNSIAFAEQLEDWNRETEAHFWAVCQSGLDKGRAEIRTCFHCPQVWDELAQAMRKHLQILVDEFSKKRDELQVKASELMSAPQNSLPLDQVSDRYIQGLFKFANSGGETKEVVRAHLELAQAYKSGHGVEQSLSKAFAHYQKARDLLVDPSPAYTDAWYEPAILMLNSSQGAVEEKVSQAFELLEAVKDILEEPSRIYMVAVLMHSDMPGHTSDPHAAAELARRVERDPDVGQDASVLLNEINRA